MKYEFVVRPGADPWQIRLSYRGVDGLALAPDGRLLVQLPGGGFEDEAPVAYQEIDDARKSVYASFEIMQETGTSPTEHFGNQACGYGFAVGEYDRSRPLIIDPSSLVYCGFIGGDWMDEGHAIALGIDGSAYVTGKTSCNESTFPAVVGPDITHNGNDDAFVAKVDPSGTRLVYCGYIGGTEDESGNGIAVDADGNAYIVGSTQSSESSFPISVGPGLTYKGGMSDAFVAKVDPSGTTLVYCGYIAGIEADYGSGIAVDGSGCAYVTGATISNETSFPVTVGPDLTYNGSVLDAFVAKINSSGTGFDYCGYIGSSGSESGAGIAVDGYGSAYITGHVGYPRVNDGGEPCPPFFPFAVGPDLWHNGGPDAFVAKLDPTGTGIIYCGLIGGAKMDHGTDIAIDGEGNAYVIGITKSSEATFPVAIGPDLTYNDLHDNNDVFVAKIEASGAALDYCGYIGGDDNDTAADIAVDAGGCAYITGTTTSTESTFPRLVGPGLIRKDENPYSGDIFVAKLDPTGAEFLYCGFISGHRMEEAGGIALDAEGHAYITGTTGSNEGWWGFFPAIAGPSTVYNGWGYEAFIAKIRPYPAVSTPQLISILPSVVPAGEPGMTLNLEGLDFVEGAYGRWDGSYRPTTFINDSELRVELEEGDLAAGRTGLVSVCNPDGELTDVLALTINNPIPTLETIIPTSVTGGGTDRYLYLRGTNFVPNSIVRWDGNPGNTDYINSTTIGAGVPDVQFAAGGAFQITVENPAPAGGSSSALVFSISTFTLTPTPISATVGAGDSAAFTILVQPKFASFDNAVIFSCQDLPQGCSGTFFPANLTLGANGLETVLTIKTKARSDARAATMALRFVSGSGPSGPQALSLTLLASVLFVCSLYRIIMARGPRRLGFAALCCFLLIIILSGCGISGPGTDEDPGTPPGTYPITVLGTSGSMTTSITVTLVVR